MDQTNTSRFQEHLISCAFYGVDTWIMLQIDRYEFLPGMPELLKQLQGQGIEMHVISNYPEWYRLVEDKLQLSQYLPWTFISCTGPMKVRRHAVFRRHS